MTHQRSDRSAESRGLSNFERNNFFHGKLMTARDMRAEQFYHRNQLQTLAGYVTGHGVVCGLETTVDATEDTLNVTVSSGLAVDRCGQLVVVPVTDTQDVNVAGLSTVWLSLRYDDCVRETVPIPGAENACEGECEYNRIVETFEIVGDTDPPDERKPVREITFPGKDEFDEPNDPDPTEEALKTIAASYVTDGERTRQCDGRDGCAVFLGRFDRDGDGNWSRSTAHEGVPKVYTNDLLYAAVARHSARFDNPHEVTAEQVEAIESVADVRNPGGDVALESVNQLLTITGIDADDEVTFEVDDRLQGVWDVEGRVTERIDDLEADLEGQIDELETAFGGRIDDLEGRVSTLERQLRRHTMEFARLAFHRLERCFDVSTDDLRDAIDEGLDGGVYETDEQYLDHLQELFELLADLQLQEELREEVRDCHLEAFEQAREELERLLGRWQDGEEIDVGRIAYAQNRLSNAVGWLISEAPRDEPIGGEPEIVSLSVSPSDEVGPDDTVTVSVVLRGDGEFVVYESRNMTEIDNDPGAGTHEYQFVARNATWVMGGYGVLVEARRDGEVIDTRTVDAPTARLPLHPTIANVDPETPTAGSNAEVTVEITNDADMLWTGINTGEFTLTADGTPVDSKEVTVDWQQTETIVFNWVPAPVAPQTDVTLEISGPDYSDLTVVTVRPAGIPLDTDRRDPLFEKRDVFGALTDVGGTEAAERIVRLTNDAIRDEVHTDDDRYRAFFDEVAAAERNLVQDLVRDVRLEGEDRLEVRAHPDAGVYAVAVQELLDAVDAGRSIDTLLDAQRRILEIVGGMEPGIRDHVLPFDPREPTIDGLEERVPEVAEIDDVRVLLALEMAGEHRKGATGILLDHLRTLER